MRFFEQLCQAIGVAPKAKGAGPGRSRTGDRPAASGAPPHANVGSPRSAMMRSQDPCDRFAVAFADLLEHLDVRQANAQSRIIRNSDIAWPTAPHLRWQAAARIGRQYGQELITKRLVSVNDPALAQAVNAYALGEAVAEIGARTYNPGAKTSIEDVVRDKAREFCNCVNAFISIGRVAEFNARALTNALLETPNEALEMRLARDVAEFLPGPKGHDRGEWLMEALRTRFAMVHTGLLSPRATVEAAVEAHRLTQLRIGAMATIDHEAAAKADPAERARMLEAAKRKIFLLAYGSVTPPADSSLKDSLLIEGQRGLRHPHASTSPA